MKDNFERQPKNPQLYDCEAFGEACALKGCFFEGMIGEIDPAKHPGEVGNLMKEEAKTMAKNSGCKIAEEL